MKATPYELLPPGKPAFSTKERFAEMRDYGNQIWKSENGFESIENHWTRRRKPKQVKTRWQDAALYR